MSALRRRRRRAALAAIVAVMIGAASPAWALDIPAPLVGLPTAAGAEPPRVAAGGSVSITAVVTNPNAVPITLIALTASLPGGTAYESSNGVGEPVLSGSDLSFTGLPQLAPGASLTFDFVLVPSTPGAQAVALSGLADQGAQVLESQATFEVLPGPTPTAGAQASPTPGAEASVSSPSPSSEEPPLAASPTEPTSEQSTPSPAGAATDSTTSVASAPSPSMPGTGVEATSVIMGSIALVVVGSGLGYLAWRRSRGSRE